MEDQEGELRIQMMSEETPVTDSATPVVCVFLFFCVEVTGNDPHPMQSSFTVLTECTFHFLVTLSRDSALFYENIKSPRTRNA